MAKRQFCVGCAISIYGMRHFEARLYYQLDAQFKPNSIIHIGFLYMGCLLSQRVNSTLK